MYPEVLILDEPTAGLDPGGREEIFELIKKLHRERNITVILSSHSMDDMAKLVKTLIVMNKGKIEFMGNPRFELIKKLHRERNITVILSSHSMDDMAKLVKTLIVMNKGKIEFMGNPSEVVNNNADRLKVIGLYIQEVLELAIKLREKGFDIRQDIITT